MSYKNMTSLTTRHRDILMRLVYFGQSKKQIAEETGLDYTTVLMITNSPLFKEEQNRELRRKEHDEREHSLKALANDAISVTQKVLQEGIVTFPNGNQVKIGQQTLMDTVRDVLDRAGHKPIERKIEAKIDIATTIESAWSEAETNIDQLDDAGGQKRVEIIESWPEVTENEIIDVAPIVDEPTEDDSPPNPTEF